jgi:hypothetical protein
MTREQLEANWGWDNETGSIPFKRPRLTLRNITCQQSEARPGTLVHWNGYPCERGLSGLDDQERGPNVKAIALASHIENVNCLKCRSIYFRRNR